MKVIKTALSFDDVLLIPQKGTISSRSKVNLQTNITKNVKLNIPMISLNMSTVTESEMAIAMAREGGIGIIHRFLPIEEQALEVKRVKRSTGRRIEDPITIKDDKTLKDAIETIESNNEVTGLLIINKEERLTGILTQRDIIFEEDLNKPIRDLMTPRKDIITAPDNIKIVEAKKILKKHRIEKLPLIDKNDKVKGLITIKDIQHLEEYEKACRDEKGRLRVAAAIGVVGDYLERARALVKENVDVLVIDIAHGHSELAIKAIKEVKKKFKVDVLAGNVATYKGAEDLIKAGADGVKVGVGNGTICTTRIVTGVGVPQFSAISEASRAGKKYKIPIINDGGIATSGNFSKALAAGASAVMFGSVFAGTDETPGPIIYRNGKQYKHYHGSTSYTSNVMNEVRNKKSPVKKFLKETYVEGVESMVPYKGPVKEIIRAYSKGLMSCMSYCNSITLSELRNKSEFIRITDKGAKESSPHDVETV